MEYIRSMPRKRVQIDLGRDDQLAFERIRGLGETDAEVGRRAVSLVARLAEAIEDGFTIVAIPADEARFADATPELTNAIAPERRYRHLVRVPHSWRRQFSLKGRRITVGQLVAQMKINGMGVDAAASAFDLVPEAVVEALDYAAKNAPLLESEAAEERRRVEPVVASSRR